MFGKCCNAANRWLAKTIAVSVEKKSATAEAIENSQSFALTVVSKEVSQNVLEDFGLKTSRETNKFLPHAVAIDHRGNPYLLEDMVARFSCRVVNKIDLGEYILRIGSVEEAEKMDEELPLTYREYCTERHGVVPKPSPSYVEPADSKVDLV